MLSNGRRYVALRKYSINLIESKEMIKFIKNLFKSRKQKCNILDDMVNNVEFCVYCKTKHKSWGSDYCGECIDNGNYIKQN